MTDAGPERPKRPSSSRRRTKDKNPEEATEEMRQNVSSLQELLRRMFDLADSDLDLDELLKVMEMAGKTCSRIQRLLKSDPANAGIDPTALLTRSMDQAIAELRLERGWRKKE